VKPGRGERAVQVLLALLKSGCYLALFLGAQVLVMMPVVIAAAVQTAMEGGAVDENGLYTLLTEHTTTFSLVANVLTFLFLVAFFLIRRKKLSDALWLRRVDRPMLLSGVSLSPGLYLVVSVALAALPEAWQESYSDASAGLDSGGVVGVIAVVVAAPVVEEFIFRGLIMTRLSRAMPGWLAVVLSAAIFGVCHGHPVWICYAFVLGTFFGLVDLRAGSIWPSILAHVAFNGIGQIITALPDTDSWTVEAAIFGVLLVVGVIAPILDRKGVAAVFRLRTKAVSGQELPIMPGVYDFDPWDT